MIILDELTKHLHDLLSIGEFPEDAPNGLQVEGKSEISKVGFAVSASLAAIEKAVEKKCDALIVHHGLFWPKAPLVVTGAKKERLKQLLGAGISLLSYHLPLDAHRSVGNNWKAALDLGWESLQPFGMFQGRPIGVKGTFPTVTIDALTHTLEQYYGHIAHTALGGKKRVSSAAIISGGAHRSIEEAVAAGVDCFITGSFDEPIWDIAHEQGINFFALGHYATERVGVLGLLEHLKAHLHLSCEWIDLPNPF